MALFVNPWQCPTYVDPPLSKSPSRKKRFYETNLTLGGIGNQGKLSRAARGSAVSLHENRAPRPPSGCGLIRRRRSQREPWAAPQEPPVEAARRPNSRNSVLLVASANRPTQTKRPIMIRKMPVTDDGATSAGEQIPGTPKRRQSGPRPGRSGAGVRVGKHVKRHIMPPGGRLLPPHRAPIKE